MTDLQRPEPPPHLTRDGGLFEPARDLEEWIRATFIEGDGPLFNPEHEHLEAARIGCLWTNVPNKKGGVVIVATAEIPRGQGAKWQKGRADQQLRGWFGEIPHFLLTFYAPEAADCSDLVFCARAEHELYHCAQRVDEYGALRYGFDGEPLWYIRTHDVEEFVGVGRRYGVGACAGRTAELFEALQRQPEIGEADAAHACGTCRR